MGTITQQGDVLFDDGRAVGPSTPQADFLNSNPDARADQGIPAPYATWFLRRNIGGVAFNLSVRFEGERIFGLDMSAIMPTDSTRWGGWSAEQEETRRTAHDTWLREVAGLAPGVFSWGRLESIFDSKSADSTITFLFNGPA